MSALEPCPYCGGENTDIEGKGMIWRGQGYGPPQYFELVHHGKAVPDDPFVTCHTRIRGRDEESLAAIWNTRTTSPRIAELEAEVERLVTYLWKVKAAINADYMGETTFKYLGRVLDEALTPKEPTPRCAECDCENGGSDCNWIMSLTPKEPKE